MKKRAFSTVAAPVIYAALGLFSCLVTGYLFAGNRIFVNTNPPFQFVIYGLAGAILFSLLKFSTLRNFLYGAALLLLLEIIRGKVKDEGILFARFVYFAGIAISIYLYSQLFDAPLKSLKFGKFLSLGGTVAAVNFVLAWFWGSLWNIFIKPANIRELILEQTFIGFMIGIGLGIGFEIAGAIKAKTD